jgi:hypothetical protein
MCSDSKYERKRKTKEDENENKWKKETMEEEAEEGKE